MILRLFSNIVTIISSGFLPVMNKKLYTAFIKVCMAICNLACLSHYCYHCWNTPPTISLCSHPQIDLHKCSANIDESHQLPLFLHKGFNDTSLLLCQMPFWQIASLQPSDTWQQCVTECWWEGWNSSAKPPTSASDIVDQHNQIGGTILRAALVKKMG